MRVVGCLVLTGIAGIFVLLIGGLAFGSDTTFVVGFLVYACAMLAGLALVIVELMRDA